jgi:aerobic carbon-monoxide dehydrogenase large subunit
MCRKAKDICLLHEKWPAKHNPAGFKGVGEIGTIGATSAVVVAVVDALDNTQVSTPLAPDVLWQHIRAKV